MYKIGILKETKLPADTRTPLTPATISRINQKYNNIDVKAEPSQIRCFSTEEFERHKVVVSEVAVGADILMGVKEVDPEALMSGKTYFMFSHTAKQQAYNRKLLQTCLEKNIRLVDYEYLSVNGRRVTAFGRWAGIVGAYNTLRALCYKYRNITLKPAQTFLNYSELKKSLLNLELPPVKIVITGTGRVSSGVAELLKHIGVKRVSESEFLEQSFNAPVYTILSPLKYLKHTSKKRFGFKELFLNPDRFVSAFAPYTKTADVYIAAHFWDPNSPVFFDMNDISRADFNINIIGDISCDIGKPVPTTIRASSIADPFYGINRKSHEECEAFEKDAITVMAVDNLPNELPRDASESFARALERYVIPALAKEGLQAALIKQATICENGSLTPFFSYLQDFVDEKE